MPQRRMFPNDPPSITFTKDHRQLVHGDLLPGREVTIVFDAERLPNERSQDHGKKACSCAVHCGLQLVWKCAFGYKQWKRIPNLGRGES